MRTPSSHPLLRLLSRRRLHICGVNTGTSIDGLDLALIAVGETTPRPRVRLLATGRRSFPPSLGRQLRQLAATTHSSKEEIARANLDLGGFIATAVNSFRRKAGAIDLIASHGQTIGHWAGARPRRAGVAHATLQIGALNLIAQRTGCVTIGDFRVADVAAGGMGAPLSGTYHHLLFGDGYVVLNLGGIANVSASRQRRGALQVRAFDVGPGNMVIDALAQRLFRRRYDREGQFAAHGRVVESIIRRALADPYFLRRPPKSCGREQFGTEWMRRLFDGRPRVTAADALATATAITARAVAVAIDRWITRYTTSRRLLIAGGGARNTTLVAQIGELLPDWTVDISDRLGIPAPSVEPVGFAVLAHETLRLRCGNIGGATGARPAILGLIALPDKGETRHG